MAGRFAIRSPLISLFGFFVAALGTAIYGYELTATVVITPGIVSSLTVTASVYFVVILLCAGLIIFDGRLALKKRMEKIKTMGEAPLSPAWIIPYVLSLKPYRRYLLVSSILYGFFYAVITSILVYQPGVDFSQAYGATIPSVVVTPVRGAPLLSPEITFYVTNHFGILLVPLTVLLLIVTSLLVGLNVALTGFAIGSRAKGTGRGWVAGIGAVVGLFTGCPTCAGLFFANALGGTGAVSFATLLGYYQPAFILLSLPVLMATPYLTSRSLSKVYRNGCVKIADSKLA